MDYTSFLSTFQQEKVRNMEEYDLVTDQFRTELWKCVQWEPMWNCIHNPPLIIPTEKSIGWIKYILIAIVLSEDLRLTEESWH